MKVEVFVEFEPNQKKKSEVECRGRKKLENSAILSEVRGQNSSEVEVNPHSSDFWLRPDHRAVGDCGAFTDASLCTWIFAGYRCEFVLESEFECWK